MSTLTLIHATPAAMPPVIHALEERPELQGTKVLHQLDEGLLSEIERRGGVTHECVERMHTQLDLAVASGSDAILTTCNAYSSVLIRDLRSLLTDVPLVVIDEPMLRTALDHERIAVLATVPAGLDSQRELLTLLAGELGRDPDVTYVLRSDAFDALHDGDGARHDQILKVEIDRLARLADVVVLAQASMARVRDNLRPELSSRVLSSPELAVAAVVDALLLRSSSGRTS